jgi:hypothetical protein
MSEQSFRHLHPILVVLAESTIVAEPGEGALHNPSQPGDLEGSLPPGTPLARR